MRSVELSEHLGRDVSVIRDRISHPEQAASSQTPKPDDFRWVVGQRLDFDSVLPPRLEASQRALIMVQGPGRFCAAAF